MALTQRERLAAIARANDPLVFPGLSRITRLDGTVGNVPLTQHQRIMLAHMKQYPWTYVCKSRQAMSSVVHILDLLRHVMYSPGQMGMIIGDKEDTYKELIRRMGVAYAGYPEAIRTELARPVSSESIAFGEPHNGIIQGLTPPTTRSSPSTGCSSTTSSSTRRSGLPSTGARTRSAASRRPRAGTRPRRT
jgi:hypothetical protein